MNDEKYTHKIGDLKERYIRHFFYRLFLFTNELISIRAPDH